MAVFSNGQIDQLLSGAERRLAESPVTKRESLMVHKEKSIEEHTTKTRKPDLSLRIPLSSTKIKVSKDTSGPQWFDCARANVTPELKRHWQLLRIRGLLDPKHRKKHLPATIPKYCHFGKILPSFGQTKHHHGKKKSLIHGALSNYPKY